MLEAIARTSAVKSLVLLFLASIFIGDVWLIKLTLPLGMLLLPLIATVRWRKVSVPPTLLPLAGMLLIVALQIYLGRSLNWRADVSVWTPIVFAASALIILSKINIVASSVRKAMLSGGAATAVVMLAMMVFAPDNVFLVPGQNPFGAVSGLQETISDPAPASNAVSPTLFSPGHTAAVGPSATERQVEETRLTEGTFYAFKNKARNLLGRSNYIAVFFVFLFAVALFSGDTAIALVLAAFVAMTLSRIGITCLVLIVVWRYWTSSRAWVGAVALALAACLLAGLLILFRGHIEGLPGFASLTARMDLVESGIKAIATRPLLGAQRSLIIQEQGSNVFWNPHNSIVWISATYGLVGLALYASYLILAMTSIARAARVCATWKGIFAGLVVILVWSLSEIIVLTPAFELLLASMCALSWGVTSNRSSLPAQSA